MYISSKYIIKPKIDQNSSAIANLNYSKNVKTILLND